MTSADAPSPFQLHLWWEEGGGEREGGKASREMGRDRGREGEGEGVKGSLVP